MAATFVRIRAGLLDPKHVAAMENAVWLYLWLHGRVQFRGQEAGCTPTNKPYKHAEAAAALGVSRRQAQRWFETLEAGGYVTAKRVRYGLEVAITKYDCPSRVDTDDQSRVDTAVHSEPIQSGHQRPQEWTSASARVVKPVHSEAPPYQERARETRRQEIQEIQEPLLTERDAPAAPDAPRSAPKPNKSGELIDLLRAEGVPFDLTPQDHKNLRLSSRSAAEVAEVYCAISRDEFGDEWLQEHLSVTQAIKAWPGYQNRKTRGPGRPPPPRKRSESGVAGQMDYLREQGLIDEFGNWLSTPEPAGQRGAAAGAYPAAGLGGGVGEARYGVPLQLPRRRDAAG